MRLRAATATAVLILCATTGMTACSSTPDAGATKAPTGRTTTNPAPADDVKGSITTGKRRAAAPTTTDGPKADSRPECATSAAEIPKECALDLSFSQSSEGQPTTGSPHTP